MKQRRQEHLTGVYKSHFSQLTNQVKLLKTAVGLSPPSIKMYLCKEACFTVEFISVFCFYFVFISLPRQFSFAVWRKIKDFKAQPFLKMHVVSGFSGLWWKQINITEKNNFLLLCKTKLRRKISQKVPVKGLPPSSYENLLFSRDCAMFFNIGYFIWK